MKRATVKLKAQAYHKLGKKEWISPKKKKKKQSLIFFFFKSYFLKGLIAALYASSCLGPQLKLTTSQFSLD